MTWQLYFTTHMTLSLIFIFIFFAIIGSFLNVIIYRYPIILNNEWTNDCLVQLNQTPIKKTEPFNISVPRSHCRHCKKTIPFWHNIPIFSYLFLKRKCRFCKTPLSIQYFLVEVLTPILSLIVIFKLGITLQTVCVLFLTCGLITLSFIDYNHQFLPDPITYVFLWFGLIISTQHYFVSSAQSIFGAATGYLFLWIIAKCYVFFRKKDGMGLGDCKMLGMIGAWVGCMALLNVLLLSTLLALIMSLILLIAKKINAENPIPFGPYIAIAGWLTILFGDQLMQWLTQCLA